MGVPLSGIYDAPQSYPYMSSPQAQEGSQRTRSILYQQPIVGLSRHSRSQIWAPPFEDTNVLQMMVSDFGGQYQILKPKVLAKIGRGFFPSDGKWTCYRRNYFSVTCGFGLHPWPGSAALYICYYGQKIERIRGFSMDITAAVHGGYADASRDLVQQTPKRNKGSERKPGRVTLLPSPPAFQSADLANLSSAPLRSQSMEYNSSRAGTAQPCHAPRSHTFERIQFQKATAMNGKRRAQQQYYDLVVRLYAETDSSVSGETQQIEIARRHSHPMVVRGRSPGYYKDACHGSTTTMGPDGAYFDGRCSGLGHKF